MIPLSNTHCIWQGLTRLLKIFHFCTSESIYLYLLMLIDDGSVMQDRKNKDGSLLVAPHVLLPSTLTISSFDLQKIKVYTVYSTVYYGNEEK